MDSVSMFPALSESETSRTAHPAWSISIHLESFKRASRCVSGEGQHLPSHCRCMANQYPHENRRMVSIRSPKSTSSFSTGTGRKPLSKVLLAEPSDRHVRQGTEAMEPCLKCRNSCM